MSTYYIITKLILRNTLHVLDITSYSCSLVNSLKKLYNTNHAMNYITHGIVIV